MKKVALCEFFVNYYKNQGIIRQKGYKIYSMGGYINMNYKLFSDIYTGEREFQREKMQFLFDKILIM